MKQKKIYNNFALPFQPLTDAIIVYHSEVLGLVTQFVEYGHGKIK
jgi:hypothetical protein